MCSWLVCLWVLPPSPAPNPPTPPRPSTPPQVTTIANKYLHRVDRSKVASKAYWNKARADAALDAAPTQVGEPAKL